LHNLKKYKFNKLYSFTSGISSKPEQAGHGSPFVSFSIVFNNYFIPNKLNDMMDTSLTEQKTYSILNGDILLTRTSETIDELAMSCVSLKDYPKATYSGFVKRLRPLHNNITYNKYMGFYLRSKLFRQTMKNNAVMTLRASLNEQIFSYLDLLLPTYSIQVKIGDFLYNFNKKIELNNKINKELEAMAKTLYDYWFVQFDFPDVNGQPYKSSGGTMVYNEELKREIPDEWEVKKITDLLDVITGKEDANFAIENGKYPFFTCADNISYCDTYAFEGKAILIAGNGNFNVKLYDGKFNAYQRTYILIPNNEQYYSIIFYAVQDQLKRLSSGSAGSIIKFITKGDVENISLVLPKEGYDGLFNQLNSITKLIEKKKQQNQELSKLRDWLLPMLMNGQVKIK
jgi:type I restriction enzyme S subunit